jgi:UDP-glucose 4-epimerase
MDIHGVYTEVMIRWMERIEQGLPPLIFGDGEQSMDFIYVVDIARANLLALKSDASDIVLNVASGTQTTLNELSAKLCAIMGHPELEAEHQEERKVNPVRRRLGSTTLARERIGFASGITLDEGLAGLVAWWRAARRAPAGVNA